ncbi:UDP-glucose 6-dehydrogenase, partial [bacterium]|nr:UDP-glucose 6-dehydrogenase [bacterium]
IKVIVYEPELNEPTFFNSIVTSDLIFFKSEVDIILANRFNEELKDVDNKIFSRDLFGDN